MLTKKERAEIAERANECVAVCGSLYEVLLGHPSACNTTYEEDMKKLLARIVDLCDTSNMLELPVDKNGEVIRPGDVVYGEDNLRYEVYQIVFKDDGKWLVLVSGGRLCAGTYSNPAAFTHKQPVTVKTLAWQIRNVLADDDYDMGAGAYNQLSRIAEQLESLSDKDE
jgi:hypothetical protein